MNSPAVIPNRPPASRPKSVFFFSDVHLGVQSPEEERAKVRRVLAFLDHVLRNGEELFILGDLFDYWFEYRYVVPRGHHHVLSRLAQLVENGVTVRYLVGNHDFWLKDFFPDELGIPVYTEPLAVERRGRRLYLHHGDGLALKDTGYRILKAVLRNRVSMFLFSLLHPTIASWLARSSSKKSRQYTGNKDYGETDGMIRFAAEKTAEGYDAVLMGHRHVPADMPAGTGRYINLGDWMQHNTYAELTDDALELKTWI